MIDVPRLLVLRTAAARGSMAAAARQLRITPSAVSQQVAALERQVGVPLVERRTTGITLTAPGRRLVAAADTIAAELAKAERHIADIAAGNRGSLTVATFASAGQRLLPQAVSALAGDRPHAEVKVMEAEPYAAVPMVRRGEADVAVVYHFATPRPPDDWGVGDTLRYVPLRRDPVRVVLPTGHRLAHHGTVRLADLADEPWVQGWADVGEMLDHYAAVAGFRPRVACYASDYLFMQSVVAAGMGVALVPTVALVTDAPRPASPSAAPDDPPRTPGGARPATDDPRSAPPDDPGDASVDGGLVALPVDPTPIRYVGAVHPTDRWHSPLVEELLTRLRATVAD
ncbi:MAG TPA: LysR family transcriptional regulator [Actinocatenispora sp.]